VAVFLQDGHLDFRPVKPLASKVTAGALVATIGYGAVRESIHGEHAAPHDHPQAVQIAVGPTAGTAMAGTASGTGHAYNATIRTT
jgi:hypothetical protein